MMVSSAVSNLWLAIPFLLVGAAVTCEARWQVAKDTPVWNVTGAPRGDNHFSLGDQLGFRIVTLNIRGITYAGAPYGGRDLCALARGANQLRCWYYKGPGAAPAGPEYAVDPDYVLDFKGGGGTNWNNLCACNGMYYPQALAGGHAHSTVYQDIVMGGSNAIAGGEGFVDTDRRTYQYVWLVHGESDGLHAYSNDKCLSSGARRVFNWGTVSSVDIATVYGGGQQRSIIGSSAFHRQTNDFAEPGKFRFYDPSDMDEFSNSVQGYIYPYSTKKGVVYNNNGNYFTHSYRFTQTAPLASADVFISAPLASEDPDADRLFGQGTVVMYHTSTRWNPTQPAVVIKGCQMGEEFGVFMVANGDVNGDGLEDLAIGAPAYSDENVADKGRVVIIFGNSTGIFAGAAGLRIQTRDFAMLKNSGLGMVLPNPSTSGATSARFGSAIAFLPDINSDGYDELIVGSPGHNGWRGRIHVFRGTSYGVDSSPIWDRDAPTGNREMFGSSIAVADWNLDSFVDFFVSGYGEFGEEGHIYLFETNRNTKLNTSFWASPDSIVSGAQFALNLWSTNLGPEVVVNMSLVFTFKGGFTLDSVVPGSGVRCESVPSSFPPTPDYTWTYKCYAENYLVSSEISLAMTIGTPCDFATGSYDCSAELSTEEGVEVVTGTEATTAVTVTSIASVVQLSSSQRNDSLWAGEFNFFDVTWRNDGPSCLVNLRVDSDMQLTVDRGYLSTPMPVQLYTAGTCDLRVLGAGSGKSHVLECIPGTSKILSGMEIRLQWFARIDPSFALSPALVSIALRTDTVMTGAASDLHFNASAVVKSLCGVVVGAFTYNPAGVQIKGNNIGFSLGILVAGPSSALNATLRYNFPRNMTYSSLYVVGGGVDRGFVAPVFGGNDLRHFCEITPDGLREWYTCVIPALPPTDSSPSGYDVSLTASLYQTYDGDSATVSVEVNTTTPQHAIRAAGDWFRNLTFLVETEIDLGAQLLLDCDPLCTPTALAVYAVTVRSYGPSAALNPRFDFVYPKNFTVAEMPQEYGGFRCEHNAAAFLVNCTYSGYLFAGFFLSSLVKCYVPIDYDYVNNLPLASVLVSAAPGYVDSDTGNNFVFIEHKFQERVADLQMQNMKFYFAENETVDSAQTLFEKKPAFSWGGTNYPAMWYPKAQETRFTLLRRTFYPKDMVSLRVHVQNWGANLGGAADVFVAVDKRFVLYQTNYSVIQTPASLLPPPFVALTPELPPVLPVEVDPDRELNDTDCTIIKIHFDQMAVNNFYVTAGVFYCYVDIDDLNENNTDTRWFAVIRPDPDGVKDNNFDSGNSRLANFPFVVIESFGDKTDEEEEDKKTNVGAQVGAGIGVFVAAGLGALFLMSAIVYVLGCFFCSVITVGRLRKRREKHLRVKKEKRRARMAQNLLDAEDAEGEEDDDEDTDTEEGSSEEDDDTDSDDSLDLL